MALHGVPADGRGQHTKRDWSTDHQVQEYIKWKLTPAGDREFRTKAEIAEAIGVTRRTLTNWDTDSDFLRELERRYLGSIGDPSRKSQIMETLFQTATDPDDPKHVAAAKEYFAIEGSLKPAKMEVSVTRDVSDLTDEQLDEILAKKVTDIKEARSA